MLDGPPIRCFVCSKIPLFELLLSWWRMIPLFIEFFPISQKTFNKQMVLFASVVTCFFHEPPLLDIIVLEELYSAFLVSFGLICIVPWFVTFVYVIHILLCTLIVFFNAFLAPADTDLLLNGSEIMRDSTWINKSFLWPNDHAEYLNLVLFHTQHWCFLG